MGSNKTDFDAVARLFAALVIEAGAIAMESFSAETIRTRLKNDRSPVSDADERIEAFLTQRLAQLAPGCPVVGEETAARGEAPLCSDGFLLVDPLDGTKEFVAHGKDFTINVALVVGKIPRAGAIFAPALGEAWFGGERAYAVRADPGGALPPPERWRELHVRPRPREGLVALISRSHQDDETRAFLRKAAINEIREVGSSIKFCRLAEGEADVYPRFGPTMEWDIAAGDAILRAAGGMTLDPSNEPLVYGKAEAGYRNGPFIAWGAAPSATLS
jgi:3'(2'), 5'-bisphosphate nucleotidase